MAKPPEGNFFERIKQSTLPVVVDFWAPWCMPCRAVEPVLKKLGADYHGRVDVWKVNSDEQPELLRKLGIYGIPTLVAFHNGQEVARRTGAASPQALGALFEAALSGEKPARLRRTLVDRLLLLGSGAALFFLAYQFHFAGLYSFLAGAGALLAFASVYDRCPIYKAVTSRLSAWLREGQE